MVCYYPKVRNNLGGDIPIDVPTNQNIGGDVSPASPAGLTPVILRHTNVKSDVEQTFRLHSILLDVTVDEIT